MIGATLYFTDDGRVSEIQIIADSEREQLAAERALEGLGILGKEDPKAGLDLVGVNG